MCGQTFCHVQGCALPTVVVHVEIGIPDTLDKTVIIHILLAADDAEAMVELVVGNHRILAVRVGYCRGIYCTVTQHLTLGIYHTVTVGKGNGLCVSLLAVIQVLEPCDIALVAVQLVAELA